MKAARALGADRALVLRYGDSGDVAEGDKSRVVGYVSAALAATTS
jgi:AmmeMemoRadiSam system protein B